jgi:hypothetical protein
MSETTHSETMSVDLDSLPLWQLIGISHRLSEQHDKLKAQRTHLRLLIQSRIDRGESEQEQPAANPGEDVLIAPGATVDLTSQA